MADPLPHPTETQTPDPATRALAGLNRLLALQPTHREALTHRAALLLALGRPNEAIADLTALLDHNPDDPATLTSRAGAFWLLDRLDEADRDLERALSLDPDHVAALVNRANVLQDRLRYKAALVAYDKALARSPGDLAAHTNRATTLRLMGRHADALAACRDAHAIDPASPDTTFNLALSLLQSGAWHEAWPAYEARLRRPPWSAAMPTFTAPLWDGQADIAGKRILLVGEQGLGDTIQFCRFAHRLTERGATVILGVDPPLRRLIASLAGVAQVVAPGDPDPAYDLFCPLMSLPARFGLTLADATISAPYLRADPTEVAAWRSRLAALPAPNSIALAAPERPHDIPHDSNGKAFALRAPSIKVGLVWSGDPRPEDRQALRIDRRRSIALSRLAPLLSVPGVTFISLQKGAASTQAAGLPIIDWTADLHDFADTAALITALDLVISVDTSVAHAAGALGKPVWLLNRFDRCWRWLTERADTPWYPTMRLFNQPAPGAWERVTADLASALAQAATQPHATPSPPPP